MKELYKQAVQLMLHVGDVIRMRASGDKFFVILGMDKTCVDLIGTTSKTRFRFSYQDMVGTRFEIIKKN